MEDEVGLGVWARLKLTARVKAKGGRGKVHR